MEYRRQVAMRCDGEDFVIALQPEDEVVFRTKDARAAAGSGGRLQSTPLFRPTTGRGRRKAAVAHVLLPSARKRAAVLAPVTR
jgi:hypothetical protein